MPLQPKAEEDECRPFWGQLNLCSLIALERQVSSTGASSLRHAERGRARPAAQRCAAPGSARHEHRKRTNNALRAGSWHWHAQASLGSPTGVASRGRAGCACLRAGLGLRRNQRQMGSLAWEGVQRLPTAGAGRRAAASPARVASSPWCRARTAEHGLCQPRIPAPRPAPRPGVVSLLLQRKKTICSCT